MIVTIAASTELLRACGLLVAADVPGEAPGTLFLAPEDPGCPKCPGCGAVLTWLPRGGVFENYHESIAHHANACAWFLNLGAEVREEPSLYGTVAHDANTKVGSSRSAKNKTRKGKRGESP